MLLNGDVFYCIEMFIVVEGQTLHLFEFHKTFFINKRNFHKRSIH